MDSLQWEPEIHLTAIKSYKDFAAREVTRVQRNLNGLSPDDQASLVRTPEDQVSVMQEASTANLAFVEKIEGLMKKAQASMANSGKSGKGGRGDISSSKLVQNLLQTFVREWSEEGLQERSECFDRLLGALDNHLSSKLNEAGSKPPRVLCPGTQLARLPFEVAQRGYSTEACEVRALLYFGSQLVRENFAKAESHSIQPFALNTCNRMKALDHVRRISMPDVAVPSLPPVRFGDFAQLYDTRAARSSFDGVLTAFAIDASPNILRYIRTVAHVVRPGGIWANFGPLAYDADHDEGHGHGVELSWDELKYAISHFFEIKEEAFADSLHAANAESMMQLQFSCVYFSAVRNDAVAEGIGESA